MLKIVGALFLAGLVAQSCAFVLKSLGDDEPNEFPPINITATVDDKPLSLTSGDKGGRPLLFGFVIPTGEANFTLSDDITIFAFLVDCPGCAVVYGVLHGSIGDRSADNMQMLALANKNAYNVTLTITEKDGKCTVDVNVTKTKFEVQSVMLLGDEVSEEFNKPAVRMVLEAYLAGLIEKQLLALLQKEVSKNVQSDCQKMKSATKQNYSALPLFRAS